MGSPLSLALPGLRSGGLPILLKYQLVNRFTVAAAPGRRPTVRRSLLAERSGATLAAYECQPAMWFADARRLLSRAAYRILVLVRFSSWPHTVLWHRGQGRPGERKRVADRHCR